MRRTLKERSAGIAVESMPPQDEFPGLQEKTPPSNVPDPRSVRIHIGLEGLVEGSLSGELFED